MRGIQIPSEVISELGVPQIVDITDQLPVNKNYTWAQLAGIRPVEQLTTIGLHHDAWPKANTAHMSDLELAKKIANDHIALKRDESKGEPGFPYHLWIRNGRVYQCNSLLDRTYGIASNNGYTVHICVTGDYFKHDVLTEPDRKALIAAIMAVKAAISCCTGIKAHCELTATDCPGYDFKAIKRDVAELQMRIHDKRDRGTKLERVYFAAKRLTDLYNKAHDPAFEFADIALEKGLQIADLMDKGKLLDPND